MLGLPFGSLGAGPFRSGIGCPYLYQPASVVVFWPAGFWPWDAPGNCASRRPTATSDVFVRIKRIFTGESSSLSCPHNTRIQGPLIWELFFACESLKHA